MITPALVIGGGLAGAGLAVLPLTADLAGRSLVPLDVEGFPIEGALSLVYPLGKATAPAVRALLEFARKEMPT